MIRAGLSGKVELELAPLATHLYQEFGPSAETGRAVEPFICAVRSYLEFSRLTTRIIVTELKKRDDVHEAAGCCAGFASD